MCQIWLKSGDLENFFLNKRHLDISTLSTGWLPYICMVLTYQYISIFYLSSKRHQTLSSSSDNKTAITYTDFYWHFINIIIILYYGWEHQVQNKTCVKLYRHWARNTREWTKHHTMLEWNQRNTDARDANNSPQYKEDLIALPRKHSIDHPLKKSIYAS